MTFLLSVLTGCQQSPANDSQTQGSSQVEGNSQEEPSGVEREKIVVALAQNTNVSSYEENHLTNLLEEELNVDLEFYYLPADNSDARTKFATMVNGGGELPDVVVGLGYAALEVADYGSKGIFLSLNDYLEDENLATNFLQLPEEERQYLLENIRSADGNIYALPKYNVEDWNTTPYRFWINKVWLDKLGEAMPATTEECQRGRARFLNEDPNGKGWKDEIPITGCTGGWGTNSFYFIMNAFEYCSGEDLTLSEDGSTVIAPFTTDAYRDGLEYMYELCQQGLLAPTAFTQDTSQLTALLSNDPQLVGCVAAGGYGYWSDSEKNPNFQEMELLPPLTGPEGKAYAAFSPANPTWEFMILKDCKNPELAFRLGDLFYREDIAITNRYGEENVDWSRDPEVTKNYKGVYEEVSGIPCSYAILNDIWSKPQNKHWYDVGPSYRGLEFSRGIDERKPEDENAVNYYALTRAMSAEYYADAHPEHILGRLRYTQEEGEEIAEIMANVQTFVKESNAAFVTGNKPLSEWDNYLDELKNMGLNRWIEIAQTAYERMSE